MVKVGGQGQGSMSWGQGQGHDRWSQGRSRSVVKVRGGVKVWGVKVGVKVVVKVGVKVRGQYLGVKVRVMIGGNKVCGQGRGQCKGSRSGEWSRSW